MRWIVGLAAVLLLLACGVTYRGTDHLPNLPPAPSLPPAWTPTPPQSATPRPTASPTPTPTPTVALSLQDRLLEDRARLEEGFRLMADEDYAAALDVWDSLVPSLHDYGEVYHERAVALHRRGPPGPYLDLFLQYALAIQNDLDRGIALSPAANGDNYYYRHSVFEALALEQFYLVDVDQLLSVAAENISIANALTPTTRYSERKEAFILFELGRCDDGMSLVRRLLHTVPSDDRPAQAGLRSAMASGYLCQRDLSRALQSINESLQMEDAPNRRWTRAIILTNLGRHEEALDELNRLIEDQPGYDGYRYYLRALIEYDLGDLEAAREDLVLGAANTWGRSGLYPYVEGLLARDEGDVDRARQDFQIAEASLLRRYGPIIDRVRRDLTGIDGEPLVVTPSTFVEVTPNPTLAPSPTARALPGDAAMPPWTRTFDLSQGTGPLVVRATDEPTFRFQPARPVHLAEVMSLEVILEPLLTVPEPEIKIYVWSSKGEWGRIEDAVWGSNPVHVPAESVLPDGSVVVSLRLRNPNPAFIENLSVRYTALLADGTTGTFGAPNY